MYQNWQVIKQLAVFSKQANANKNHCNRDFLSNFKIFPNGLDNYMQVLGKIMA